MAKKKKKKPQPGGRRPSYAQGKRVEPEEEPKKKPMAKAARPAPTGEKPVKKGSGEAEPTPGRPGRKKAQEAAPPSQFNLIKRDTLELKVFLYLLVVIAAAALLQYPLAIQDATTQYNKLKKQYPTELKKFEQKYPAKADQEKHAKEKPVEPTKPTFKDFIIYQWLFLLLQGALFAFLALNIQRRTDMQTPVFDKIGEKMIAASDLVDLLKWSIPFAALTLVPPVVATAVGNSIGFIKASDFKKIPTWKYSLSYINIAISNEILFTFLLVTLLVYLFTRYRDRLMNVEPHWAAIALATALHFGYIFWISRAAGEKTGTALIGAAFLAVSLVSVLGYLYWRKGLEYSLLAGAIGFGLYPFIAKLIVR